MARGCVGLPCGHVLRHAAQHRAFHNKIVAPDDRPRLHRHSAHQVTAIAEHHPRFHHAERAYTYIRSKFGMRADNGERMNRHC